MKCFYNYPLLLKWFCDKFPVKDSFIMFSKKKPPSKRAGQSLAQYGLFDIPDNLDDVGGEDSCGDSDLEAELAAIAGGGGKKKAPNRPKPKALPQAHLDKLVADSLKDLPSDEELSDGDDDPDILNELQEIVEDEEEEEAPAPPPRASRPAPPPPAAAPESSMTQLLQTRLDLYILAEKNAKEAGDTSKARRFNRGQKTLKDLLKQAKAGNPINEEDIPPVVSTGAKKPAPPPQSEGSPTGDADMESPKLPEPIQPTVMSPEEPQPQPDAPMQEPPPTVELSEETKEKLIILNERKSQYKMAALASKKSGDIQTALAYLKLVKQFEAVIQAVTEGHFVDLSDMPGPPGEEPPPAPTPPKEEAQVQQSTDTPSEPISEEPIQGLITASSVEEALQQRLQLYRNQEAAAKDAGNSSKARRMGRIVKQFEQALKLHKTGKPIPFDELPNPPGYAPIPGAPGEEQDPPPAQPVSSQPEKTEGVEPKPSSSGKPLSGGGSIRKSGNQIMTGHAGQQLVILLKRQKEFKEAALNAKKNGEQAEALAYLRSAKGMDPLIEAARGGLPVDLSSVPLPPQAKQQLEDSFDIITPADCDPDEEESLVTRLERQLTEQLRLCLDTGEHHKAMGDVAGTNRFHHLALAVKQDLDVVKLAKRSGSENIKFHYETKEFSVVQCCTDLGDNDLELTIVRGISYTVANPKEIDTYVKFEFPYPTEAPTSDRTSLVKDTNSPEYNAVFNIAINRQSRPCVRIFKRQAVKLEVYSRGGFFTRDSLIGTVMVKLQPLETQTVLHDSFDIMNGRKTVGGKLEVKIRVRHPLLTKQVEQSSRKWLVIDH